MKLSERTDIPVLAEWVNLTEAGEMLGVTRQYIFRQATDDKFETLHRIGTKPVFVLARSEVDKLVSKRAEEEQSSSATA